MELWIRSQDKETLLKISRLYLGYSGLSIESGYCQLGIYKTKERALEVLDEIQKIVGWIQNDFKCVTAGEIYGLKGCYDYYVYEMPKE